MTPTPFGTLPDGRTVHALTLTGGGLTARVLTLGATVQDLRMEGVDHPLVLGFDDLAPYLAEGCYFGALVGRFANRIGGAGFTLDGREYRTDANFRGRHTLHGGTEGTHAQIWQVAAQRADAVLLVLDLPDGHMGFPGNLRITVRISLGKRALRLSLRAETDAPTPCSLAHHGYFDLDGRGDIRGHQLEIAADHYLPIDDDLIPAGPPAPVAGTAFDFRRPRLIGPGGYDHNFCLSDGLAPLRDIARLTGSAGIAMTVATTACGLQFYDGAGMSDLGGLDGRRYGPFAGVALETQGWPDAPNRPDFPDSILRPGQIWTAETHYRFAPVPA
ncbi:aldose epimerase family protein [Paracoccus xiamenensis]|uniref:aldose epimerase family protein n=1 Tax=Paracoccus xiamenensis TaxID=2714901 RepID=UPI00140B9AF0|nr:aldose epimerase family protein [Paracoccus xiamenensis]NHF74567.1 galactose mutarotase [Paracoccus xiamenensis]